MQAFHIYTSFHIHKDETSLSLRLSSKLSDPSQPLNTQRKKKPPCTNTSSPRRRNTTHRSHPLPSPPPSTSLPVNKKPKSTTDSLPGRRVSNTSITNPISSLSTPVLPAPSKSLPANTILTTIPPNSSPAVLTTTATTPAKTTSQRVRVAMPPASPESSFSTPLDFPNSLPIWCGPTKNTYPISSTKFIFKVYAVPCVVSNGRIVALYEHVGSASGIAWGFRGVFLVSRDINFKTSMKDNKYVSKKKEIVPREPADEVLKVQARRSCKVNTGKLWGIEENEEE